MSEVPNEIRHDPANDQARHELEGPEDMEWYTRILAGSCLRSSLE